MDLYCPTCGEPWDNDSFHEEAQERGTTYGKVAAEFRRIGCRALTEAFGPQTHCVEGTDDDRAAMAGVLYDLLGDDMDGAAAMFEDSAW